MQASNSSALTALPSLNVTDSLHASELNRTSEENITPETSAILAEIEADRDYYESCGRW